MAIKSFLRSLSAGSLVLLAACQTAPRKSSIQRPESVIATAPNDQSPAAPAPRSEAPKVAVILGPGGAKAFAHVGVLRALESQRIPIHKIVGLEWGALVAGLFAANGQIHDVEWKLYKMQQKNLPHGSSKGFFTKNWGEDSVKSMDDYLAESFLKESVGEAKIPFECPSRSLWSGVVAWQNRGAMKDAVKRCLPFPPIFKAQGTFLAGASQAKEAVERLKEQGYSVILFVNVLGNALPVSQDNLLENLNYAILWQEIRRELQDVEKLNVEVIRVDTNAYPLVQFDAAKDLAALGEAAALKAAPALVSKYGF